LSKFTTLLVVAALLPLAGCSSGGNGGGNDGSGNSTAAYYKPLTANDANQKYAEQGYTTDLKLVHEDGLQNSELDIADLNIVLMSRAGNGNIFLSFDAMIYSFGHQYLDPNVWAGSNRFTLYIDNDNDTTTGYPINGIGADIKLFYVGQAVWNSMTNDWDTTWFSSAPPTGGAGGSFGGRYEVHTDIQTGVTYFRSFQQINYLDTLTINTNAKGVLQITYDILVGLNIVEKSLDTTSAFEMPDF